MNNEKKRGLLATMLVCLAMIIGFGLFRFPAGPASDEPEGAMRRDAAVYRHEEIFNTAHASLLSYTLRLEESKLNLYLKSDTETLLLESFDFNASHYPKADVDELEEGVTLSSIVDCVGLIEDFTS